MVIDEIEGDKQLTKVAEVMGTKRPRSPKVRAFSERKETQITANANKPSFISRIFWLFSSPFYLKLWPTQGPEQPLRE